MEALEFDADTGGEVIGGHILLYAYPKSLHHFRDTVSVQNGVPFFKNMNDYSNYEPQAKPNLKAGCPQYFKGLQGQGYYREEAEKW